MKVIIAGSRTITSFEDVLLALVEADFLITEVVSGKARGVDALGEKYAITRGVPIKSFPANWKKYGRSAGPIRNNEMMEYADALIAIWDGKSRGTMDMIMQMRNANKKVYVKIINKENKENE